MGTPSFLVDLAWVIGLGALAAVVFQRLKQPLVLGYLLAGLLLNARVPLFPNVHHLENIHLLAELGVIFIMFFIGLHFNFKKLKQLGAGVALAGVLEVSLVTWLGFVVAQWMGYKVSESVFFGALFCTASTTIIAKSLHDEGRMNEDFASVIVGMTLVEDLAAIGILVFLSGIATTGAFGMEHVLAALFKVVAFTAGAAGIGLWVVPRFLKWVDRVGTGETLSLACIGICFGVASLATFFGISTALGSFLAGAIIAESGIAEKIEKNLSSVRDLFLMVFFVTVGLQFQLPTDSTGLWLIPAGLFTALFGRSFAGCFGAILAGYNLRTSLHAGLSLTAIGELSFVIANLGIVAGAIPTSFFSMAVAVSTLLTVVTPYFVRRGDVWADRVESSLPGSWRTLLSRYQSWVSAISWPMRHVKVPSALYPLVGRAAILILLMVGAVYANHAIHATLNERGITQVFLPGDAKFLHEIMFGLVYFSLFLLSLGTLRRIFRHVLKASGEKMDPKGQVLVSLAQFVSASVIGVLFLAFASPFVSTTTLLLVGLGVILSRWGILKKTLSRVDTRFDFLVKNIVDSYGMAETSGGAVQRLMKERYPWDASLTDFMLPPTFCAVHQTLADLRVRKKTGASVIAVYRGEACVANPAPSFQLLPSDVLVLLGEKEHLESAASYLRECCTKPHPQMEIGGEGFHLDTAVLAEGSFLAGKTLRELSFRDQTGASVVGLERDGVRYTTNLPEIILQDHDVLLLLGDPKEVAHAKEVAESASAPLGWPKIRRPDPEG